VDRTYIGARAHMLNMFPKFAGQKNKVTLKEEIKKIGKNRKRKNAFSELWIVCVVLVVSRANRQIPSCSLSGCAHLLVQ
jgi:hypothetical protein